MRITKSRCLPENSRKSHGWQLSSTLVTEHARNVGIVSIQSPQDNTGELIYIARARHEGANLTGKLITSQGCAIVTLGWLERRKREYQVLLGGPNNWVPTQGSNVPPGAFPGGESEDGEPLFIGRVRHEGSVTTGKVQQSHGVCYISFGGQELGFPDYEILMS